MSTPLAHGTGGLATSALKVWFWLAVVAGVLVLLLGLSNVRAALSQARR